MHNFLSKLAQGISPYTAGEQPQGRRFVKLNTNENPYPPSPMVAQALTGLDYSRLKLYSDPENQKLKAALAAKYNLAAKNVFVGNGSDEVLAFCYPTFFDPKGAGIAYADVTYSFYPVWADLYGIKKVTVPLRQDFTQHAAAYKTANAQGIVLANPNAPTGIAMSARQVEELIRQNPDKLVIVDEAYAAFSGGCSVAHLVNKHNNLLVVNTFSKACGLAGIRCGYALGHSVLIDALTKIKHSFNSYTVNTVTEALAVAALSDEKYYAEATQRVIKTRGETAEKLKQAGFEVLDSAANFLFISPPDKDAEGLYKRLKDDGVLIRHWNSQPRIRSYARVSIGTDAEMSEFLSKVAKFR